MINNYFLKEYLRNYRNRRYFNSSTSTFLTPCEALNKYIKDPCSMFIENIIPIDPNQPMPPMPLMPPFPPIPPRLDFAILEGAGVLQDSFEYPLVPIEIVGNTIEYEQGFFSVRLAPGRRYSFTWRTITEVNAMPFEVGGLLTSANGRTWPGSVASTNMTTRPGIVELSKSGILVPNGPQSVIFVFISNVGPLQTSGTLEIQLLP